MSYPQPAVLDFFKSFVSNIGALMSGALSVPFAYWGLFQAPDNQKSLFLLMACFSFILSAYFVWVREREKVIEVMGKLAKIGSKFSLVYENAELKFGDSRIEVGLRFKNVGEEMLIYELSEIVFFINKVGTKIQPDNSKTHIHAGGEMQYHFDVTGISKIDFSQPAKIEIGFTAQYDNIEPVRRRFTKRHIVFEYDSLIPLLYKQNTIIESGEGFL